MATNFPTSLDTFTVPSGTSTLGGSTPNHTTLHQNTVDSVAALETKVGVNGSAVTTSLDYRVNAIETDYVTKDTAQTISGAKTFSHELNVTRTAADWAYTSMVSGDANPRFNAHVGGTVEWSDGTNAADTNLYRSAANTLKTDDSLVVGTNLTVTGIGADLYVTKASSTSRNTTTTVTSDPNLTLSVAANATYVVDCTVVWTNGGGGFRCAWTGPAGATLVWTDNDGAGNGTISTQSTFISTVGTTLKGALVTAGTSGTFALQWAQNTSNAANTTLLAGCYLWLRRVA